MTQSSIHHINTGHSAPEPHVCRNASHTQALQGLATHEGKISYLDLNAEIFHSFWHGFLQAGVWSPCGGLVTRDHAGHDEQRHGASANFPFKDTAGCSNGGAGCFSSGCFYHGLPSRQRGKKGVGARRRNHHAEHSPVSIPSRIAISRSGGGGTEGSFCSGVNAASAHSF